MCNLYYSGQPRRTPWCVPEVLAWTKVTETPHCVNMYPSENAFRILTRDPGNLLPSPQTFWGGQEGLPQFSALCVTALTWRGSRERRGSCERGGQTQRKAE